MDTGSRVYALRALGRIGGEAGLAVVGEALADSDPQVFDQGLRLAGEEKLLPAVGICRRAFVGAPHGESRRRAAQLLLRCGEEGVETLMAFAAQGELEERVTAALLLAETGTRGPLVALAGELLDGRDSDEQGWIETYGSADRLPDLFWDRAAFHFEHLAPVVEGLSEDWSERKAAVRLLHHWDRLTSQMQSRAAADPHVAVRRAAATLKIRAC